ncbi:NAD(P)-dependent oxidoreductase [Poseidonibacter ostreae]|jgi:3-hydroxyisobutyrate dehydrogenase-like beta-hydroxyacid dehydrogenase|uniref:NAD-binding protein n=1 Tax=Poseidonibacter ostreae TaxID=2654171 RepID=A0A6L4WVF3_9BACT|nr:NAD(P)-dependent oxidoreductase [Poseidonibacter ostreae]KAB7886845.1 NAD-binding protein [Poseidonibacter ostreae]KAB7890488.1 NAD-binding protein [Poseidonibacter ostreae]KAB7890919.1 NAD-binding protein [Poseidonibacter ostreae]
MSNTKLPKIGFIGLGLMGSAIVNRLQDLNYTLTVLGRKRNDGINKAESRGATVATNASEVAQASDIIFICVDTSKSVESIMLNENGLLEGLKAGSLVIDLGTSLPESTKMLGDKIKEKGASYMDAPLGRTPKHALDGLLNIMSAGEKSDFDRVKPVLEDIGENVFHVGALGAGHTLKLINNFFGMTLATAMSESFAMADLAGIKREDLYGIMSAGPLHSMMMDFVKANAVDGNSKSLGFSIGNAHKDLSYYVSMTEALNVTSGIATGTKATLGSAVDQGKGDLDVPDMVSHLAGEFAKTVKK